MSTRELNWTWSENEVTKTCITCTRDLGVVSNLFSFVCLPALWLISLVVLNLLIKQVSKTFLGWQQLNKGRTPMLGKVWLPRRVAGQAATLPVFRSQKQPQQMLLLAQFLDKGWEHDQEFLQGESPVRRFWVLVNGKHIGLKSFSCSVSRRADVLKRMD